MAHAEVAGDAEGDGAGSREAAGAGERGDSTHHTDSVRYIDVDLGNSRLYMTQNGTKRLGSSNRTEKKDLRYSLMDRIPFT